MCSLSVSPWLLYTNGLRNILFCPLKSQSLHTRYPQDCPLRSDLLQLEFLQLSSRFRFIPFVSTVMSCTPWSSKRLSKSLVKQILNTFSWAYTYTHGLCSSSCWSQIKVCKIRLRGSSPINSNVPAHTHTHARAHTPHDQKKCFAHPALLRLSEAK